MGAQPPQMEGTSAGRFLHEPASHLSDKASDILSDTSPANARLRGWLGATPLRPRCELPRRFYESRAGARLKGDDAHHKYKSDAENHSAVK